MRPSTGPVAHGTPAKRPARFRAFPRLLAITPTIFAGFLLSTSTGCEQSDDPPATAAPTRSPLPSAEFADLFRRTDSIVLEQPVDYPIVVVSGLDVSPDGTLAISDARDARIGVYSRAGKLLFSIGRRGEGPGEFEYPLAPRFDEAGRIHVMDRGHSRISIFSNRGDLLRDFAAPTDMSIHDMELTRAGYIIGGLHGEGPVLMALDSMGVVQWEALDLAAILPRGQPDSGRWNSIRRHRLTVAGDTVFAISALADSIWALDVGTPDVQISRSITVADYQPPKLPTDSLDGVEAITNWGLQQMVPVTVEGDGRLLVVPFARGPYIGETLTSAAMRTPLGEWLTVNNTPRVLSAIQGRVYTVERPTLDMFVIGIYEWQRP
jgi:hypothetical protein